MIAQGIAIWVHYKVWDSANKVWLTGDDLNHTLYVLKDGVLALATNTPQPVTGIVHKVLLTGTEVNGLLTTLGGITSTPDAYIIPVHMLTDGTTKGVNLSVPTTAWDMANDAPKTGDVANHTMSVTEANAASVTTTNNPTEVSAANMPGVSVTVLEPSETDGPIDTVSGVSSTADVVIMPTTFPVALAPDPADEADVLEGVVYDNGNLTGTLVPLQASYELPQEIILEDEEIIIFEGCAP